MARPFDAAGSCCASRCRSSTSSAIAFALSFGMMQRVPKDHQSGPKKKQWNLPRELVCSRKLLVFDTSMIGMKTHAFNDLSKGPPQLRAIAV